MISNLIIKALEKATGVKEISLEIPVNSQFGDYSSNIVMQLWKSNYEPSKEPKKLLKKAQYVAGRPRELAKDIIKGLEKDTDLMEVVKKIEAAGPGFLNFHLKEGALIKNLEEINEKGEEYGNSEEGEGKTVVVDYSSPNIAKRFGIGHLRSTVIGQALYNLYQKLGYKVIGDNHLGDWGTQFGVLLYQITSKNLDPEKLSIEELEKLYVEFHQEEEKDPSLHEKAKEWFKKLEEKDPEARRIWKILVETSLKEFQRIYALLGIKIDYAYGESFYEDYMPQVIRELKEKGLLKKSEGAEIVELPNLTPAMIVKSDGTTTYLTRDLATIKFRLESWNPDLVIYEVGNDQTFYFRQVFAVVKLLDWGKGKKFVHVNHGLIRFEHGKMSTRGGKTIQLEEVLDEAVKRAKEIIEKSETGRGLSEKEKEGVAKEVGVGAIVYFDLSHHPTSDIIFDWEKMFVLEGNSGPYLQYTLARINSVLEKAKERGEKKEVKPNLEELSLLRTLIHYEEVVKTAAESFSPNLMTNYLFDLAQKFNNFYNNHRILESDNSEFRIELTSATGQILKNGLKILGIETPERM